MRVGLIFWTILLTVSCSRTNKDARVSYYYDSLASELFLSPEIDLKVTSNVDSTTIDFFDDQDFRILLDVRQLCQAVSDSFGIHVNVGLFVNREFELTIDEEILRYDTALFPLIDRYLVDKDQRVADSLKQVIGIHPATIHEYHNKVERYFEIMRKDKKLSKERTNMVITYYVSELTEVPYPQSLFRLFVSNKLEILDYGSDINYNYKAPQDQWKKRENATAYNRLYKSYTGSIVMIDFASKSIKQCLIRHLIKPHTLYI